MSYYKNNSRLVMDTSKRNFSFFLEFVCGRETECLRNGILLPKLFWPTVRKKNVHVIEKNF